MRNHFGERGVIMRFICLLILLAICVAPEATAQVTMKQMVLEQEDGTMFSDMRKVSNWINQYCIWNHRFPEQGDEMREAKAQLNQLIPNNPYINNKLYLSQGLDADPVYADPSIEPTYSSDYQKVPVYAPSDQAANFKRVKLVMDPSLTEIEIQEWERNPPDEWSADPGTVTVISNQQNLYVVWGAGYNGKPLRNPLSRVTDLIIGRYALLNNGE
jgi:hypothetical protein